MRKGSTICDKCGKETTTKGWSSIVYHKGGSPKLMIDLCQDCEEKGQKLLKDWIAKPEEMS